MTTQSSKYTEMSRNYLARAEDYLSRGDLAQACEKSWGAAACALKSIAEQRGWHHRSHSLLYDLSGQVADELDRQDLRGLFAVANTMHQNFYENWFQEDEVEYGIGRVKTYLADLEAVSPQMPDSFVVETRAQRRRLERLAGQSEPL